MNLKRLQQCDENCDLIMGQCFQNFFFEEVVSSAGAGNFPDARTMPTSAESGSNMSKSNRGECPSVYSPTKIIPGHPQSFQMGADNTWVYTRVGHFSVTIISASPLIYSEM